MRARQLHLPDLDEVAIGTEPVAGDETPQPPPPVPRRLLPRLTGLLLTWLPMIVLALAAVFTWWLTQSSPAPRAAGERVLRDEPDYTLDRFTIDRFEADGRHGATLAGETLRHYQVTDIIEIDRIALDARLPDNRPLTASAHLGVLAPGSHEVQLQGNAQVQGRAPDGSALALRGERLSAWTDTHRVHTDAPVTVEWGSSRLYAAGLDYDAQTEQLNLAGPMHAQLVRPGPLRSPSAP